MGVPGILYTEEFIRTHQQRWSSKMEDWFATVLNMGDTLTVITRREPDNGLLRPALDITPSPDQPDTFSVAIRPEYEELEPLAGADEDLTEDLGVSSLEFGPGQTITGIYLCKTVAAVRLFGASKPDRTLADRYGTISVARDNFGLKRLLVVQMPAQSYAGLNSLEIMKHDESPPRILPGF